ncbi:Uncharacterised protein, partial [uncultured Comamonas sp.]
GWQAQGARTREKRGGKPGKSGGIGSVFRDQPLTWYSRATDAAAPGGSLLPP